MCRLPTSRAPAANALLEQQAAVHLPDVLRQVPQVLNPLPVASLKLLQTVNKQCRLAVHHHVVNLTLCTHDTESVAGSLSQLIIDWYRLQSLIILKPVDNTSMGLLTGANFSQMRRLELPYLDLSSVAICMLATGNWPQLQHIDISGNVVTREAISSWRMANWPELQTIVMQDVQIVQGQEAGIMWQLARASLPSLTQLDLSQNNQTGAVVSQLALKQWPLLKALSIGAGVHISIFQSLRKADWPKALSIEEADIAETDVDDKTSMTVKWPLPMKTIAMIDSEVDLPLLAWLLQPWGSTIVSLNLSESQLGSEAFDLLSKAKFPALSTLILSHTGMHGHNMSILAEGSWPALTHLELDGNRKFGETGFLALISAHLPKLISLSLNGISISDFSSAQLAQGKWPQLKTIMASSCCLSTQGILDILDGNWQNLEFLDVSRNPLAAFLDIDAISVYLGFAEGFLKRGLNRLTGSSPVGNLTHLQVIDLSW